MQNNKKHLLSVFTILVCLSACTKEEPPKLSFEEAAHEQSIKCCISLMVQDGAKWTQGDQVVRLCERNRPTRPQIARYEIMKALKERELVPKETESFYSLPLGKCKESADRYVELQEAMYHSNPGDERTANEDESNKILTQVQAGECPAIAKPVAKVG